MVIYFGKYKGQDVEEIPDYYLKFITEHFDDGEIQSACEVELNFRIDNNTIGENP